MRESLNFQNRINPQAGFALLRYLLGTVMLGLVSLPVFAQEGGITDERLAFNLSSRMAIAIIAAIIAFITRAMLLRVMKKKMMLKSKTDQATELETDSSGGESELPAHQDLQIKELNADSEIAGAVEFRANLVGRARSGMWKLFFTDLAAIAAYVTASLTSSHGDPLLGVEYYKSVFGENYQQFFDVDMERFIIYYFALGLLLIWNLMRIVGHRHQFTAHHRGLFGLIKPFWAFFFWLFQTRWCQLLAVVVLVNAFIRGFFPLIAGDFSLAIPMLGAVVFHCFLLYRLKAGGRKRPNLQMLILRVFAINKTSYFTFAGLAKYWQHFGSYFTVADPSFYRVYWRRQFNFVFPIFILVALFFYTKLTDGEAGMDGANSAFGGFVAMMLMAAVLYIIYSNIRMKRSFVTSEDHLRSSLQKLARWPIRFSNTFKDFPVMCHDNTWKMAVAEFARTAEVILMDLRGFSESNKGCEFEINFLFDHVPTDRIVFLAYADSVPLIRQTIAEQWRLLHAGSPNLGKDRPAIKLYVVGKENNREIQRILDLLLETAGNASV